MPQFQTLNKKELLNKALVVLLFAVTSFIFLTKSPLHPWVGGNTGTDSSVFKTVCLMMKHGYMPYRDTFDHKGPLIYLINYIGMTISDYRGVWLIEYASMLVSTLAMYKLARLAKCSSLQAIITVFTAISLLFTYFENGNFTEEYAMPLIAISTVIFIDYLSNDVISRARLVLCGLCLGGILMLRANMLTMWLVFSIAVLVHCLRKKEYQKLGQFIIWFLVGMLICILPFIIWLAANHSLKDFWDVYIGFNRLYSSAEGGRALLTAKWKAFFTYANTVPFYIAMISCIFLIYKKKDTLYIVNLIYLVVSLLMMAMSGMTYGHYGMVLIPAIVFPIAGSFAYINEQEQDKKVISYVLALGLLCNLILADWGTLMTTFASKYDTRNQRHISAAVQKLTNVVKDNSSPEDKISVYGNYDIVYVISERQHATRYSYQFPIGTISPAIMNEYWEQLKAEQPPVIVVQTGHYDQNIQTFLSENNYILVWAEKPEDLNGCYPVFKKE